MQVEADFRPDVEGPRVPPPHNYYKTYFEEELLSFNRNIPLRPGEFAFPWDYVHTDYDIATYDMAATGGTVTPQDLHLLMLALRNHPHYRPKIYGNTPYFVAWISALVITALVIVLSFAFGFGKNSSGGGYIALMIFFWIVLMIVIYKWFTWYINKPLEERAALLKYHVAEVQGRVFGHRGVSLALSRRGAILYMMSAFKPVEKPGFIQTLASGIANMFSSKKKPEMPAMELPQIPQRGYDYPQAHPQLLPPERAKEVPPQEMTSALEYPMRQSPEQGIQSQPLLDRHTNLNPTLIPAPTPYRPPPTNSYPSPPNKDDSI